jgi:hypothetical protein
MKEEKRTVIEKKSWVFSVQIDEEALSFQVGKMSLSLGIHIHGRSLGKVTVQCFPSMSSQEHHILEKTHLVQFPHYASTQTKVQRGKYMLTASKLLGSWARTRTLLLVPSQGLFPFSHHAN